MPQYACLVDLPDTADNKNKILKKGRFPFRSYFSLHCKLHFLTRDSQGEEVEVAQTETTQIRDKMKTK